MTRPWREEVAEVMARGFEPDVDLYGDDRYAAVRPELEYGADQILAKFADLLGSDEVREAVARALAFGDASPHVASYIEPARDALAALREMVGGA